MRRYGTAAMIGSWGIALAAPAQTTPPSPSTPPGNDTIIVLKPVDVQRHPGDDAKARDLGFVKGLQFLLPVKWEPQKPSNPMRLVQLTIPPLTNEAFGPGTLTISAGIGGTVDENIARWVAQFSELDAPATQQDLQIIGTPLLATQVICTGTYNAAMPGAEPDLQPATTMYAAIVQGGPEGIVFIKAWGPKETMAERRVAWDVFLRNLKVAPKPVRAFPGRTEPPATPDAPATTPPPPAGREKN